MVHHIDNLFSKLHLTRASGKSQCIAVRGAAMSRHIEQPPKQEAKRRIGFGFFESGSEPLAVFAGEAGFQPF